LQKCDYFVVFGSERLYDRVFNKARPWALGEGIDEPHTAAARIYHVKEEALRKSINRKKNKKRNSQGVFNQHGGNNKILN
jgi:hypothetical protein